MGILQHGPLLGGSRVEAARTKKAIKLLEEEQLSHLPVLQSDQQLPASTIGPHLHNATDTPEADHRRPAPAKMRRYKQARAAYNRPAMPESAGASEPAPTGEEDESGTAAEPAPEICSAAAVMGAAAAATVDNLAAEGSDESHSARRGTDDEGSDMSFIVPNEAEELVEAAADNGRATMQYFSSPSAIAAKPRSHCAADIQGRAANSADLPKHVADSATMKYEAEADASPPQQAQTSDGVPGPGQLSVVASMADRLGLTQLQMAQKLVAMTEAERSECRRQYADAWQMALLAE